MPMYVFRQWTSDLLDDDSVGENWSNTTSIKHSNFILEEP